MGKEKTHSIGRFMDLPAALEDSAKYEVLLCPYEKSTRYLKGTTEAPLAILKESHNIEPYDASLGVNAASKGIVTTKTEKPEDISFSTEFGVVVGGEHTITYFSSREFDEIVVLDAHLDLLDEYDGQKIAHATWLRRVVEKGKEAHIIGARSGAEEEWEYARSLGLLKEAKDLKGKQVYLSIDVDVLDLSVMPCCSNPEPAGMQWSELLAGLEHIFKNNKVLAADIVEHKPCENLRQYSYSVAWLVYKLFSFKEKYG